jgi:hypothetical protein
VIQQAKAAGGYSFFSVDTGSLTLPGLFTGQAGVALALLEAAEGQHWMPIVLSGGLLRPKYPETAAPGEEEGAEHTPNPVEIETVVDDNPEGAHANLGVISPQTNILVHVSHQNAGSVDTTTSTVNAAPKGEEEEGADDDRATTSASEAREITDFIRGALDSVADFQKQESRQLMETLGKTLVHGIRAMRTGAQPR